MFYMSVIQGNKPRGKIQTLIGLHVLVWALYFFYENGIILLLSPGDVTIVSTLILFVLNSIVFYVHTFFILARTLPQRRYLQLIMFSLLLCAFYILVNYLITEYLESRSIQTVYSVRNPKEFIIWRLFRFIYFISLSYAYYLAVNTIRTERRLRKMNEEKVEETKIKARLEKEILSTELDYLRYQIHPHFLFNTLSFIYTQVIDLSKDAAQSVMLLSDIMRYALHHNEGGKVELEQEVQHIRNLLDIHQLRFNHRLSIQLELNDTAQFKYRRIAPLMLITFVENALKYGELQEPENPLTIRIGFEDNQLYFYTRNKKKINQQQMVSGGVGLANIKRRLSLLYAPDDYSLDIEESAYFYIVNLKINL